jgi:hypothetical protein
MLPQRGSSFSELEVVEEVAAEDEDGFGWYEESKQVRELRSEQVSSS